MKITFYIIGLISLIQSCGIENSSTTNGNQKKTHAIDSKKVESETAIIDLDHNAQGRKELAEFENKYESKWSEKPEIFPYSKGRIFKVYELDCSGECFKSEFRKRKSEGIEIAREDFLNLIKLLKNPKSYDNSTAACYDPKFGLIVYDKDNVPSEFLSICLGCNNFRTFPGQIEVSYENKILCGFSRETRNQLRQMFFKWQKKINSGVIVDDACYELMFVKENNHKFSSGTLKSILIPPCYTLNNLERPFRFEFSNKFTSFCIKLQPWMNASYVPTKESQVLDLNELYPKFMNPLHKNLFKSTTFNEMIFYAEEFLLSLDIQMNERTTLVKNICDFIYKNSGNVTVNEIADQFDIYRQKLNTIFKQSFSFGICQNSWLLVSGKTRSK